MGIWLNGIVGLLVIFSTIAAMAMGLIAIEDYYDGQGGDE